MHCGWLRCHVVWFEMVVWGELEDDLVIRTTQIYSVLHSTTKYYPGTILYYTVLLQYYKSTTPVLILYYKVLLRYYSVLESTTPVLLQHHPVPQSTTPVLLCTTKYYSSTTPYYKVLLQYYAVLQSTTPGLFCTTKYYSSTTLYYKVLLQYHSVLQRTTPVLVYKVLLQYCSVLQTTTPVLLCTTKYYSSTSLYYNAQSNRTHPPLYRGYFSTQPTHKSLKNTAFRDFPNISRLWIFFLLTFAQLYLLSSDSTSLLCFFIF